MADPNPAPLILCMENAVGEDIALRIEPEDDFQTFLDKAKSILGFDVDINTITRNQPVSLDDNIYQFLINSEHNYETELNSKNFDQILDQTEPNDDLVYVLNDGTQIRASQIHFDNEDPHVDLTTEKIPFVKLDDDEPDDQDIEIVRDEDIRTYNILDSPVSRRSPTNSSPECSFVNSIPFKLVSTNTFSFEAQFTKYLEASTKTYATLNPVVNRNKSPRSVINDNYKNYEDNFNRHDNFTREEILNMFKDSPVASQPYENPTLEKRRHIRKTDPSRLEHKSWNSKPNYDDGMLIGDSESQDCFICERFVANNLEKLYIFDNEDQKIHRASPQKKLSRQLKIICETCLSSNFKPCRMKSPNQSLNPDEYLVIKNNQQYIFQKTTAITFKSTYKTDNVAIRENVEAIKQEKVEFVNVEIGSDGEIITKPVENELESFDEIVIKEDVKDSSSDVEIIETPDIDDSVIDNLDDADEEVKEFLGKYHCDGNGEAEELKCRFCDTVFATVSEAIDHGAVHRHEMDDGVVYPCPLCSYGYANIAWLKGHLKAAHDKMTEHDPQKEDTNMDSLTGKIVDLEAPDETSPIAKRTRSSIKKCDNEMHKVAPEPIQDVNNTKTEDSPTTTVKLEVKEECAASSDEEIWIVQTDDGGEQLQGLLDARSKGTQQEQVGAYKRTHKCVNCSKIFTSAEVFSSHKCRRRSRTPKCLSQDEGDLYVPTTEDFIKNLTFRTLCSVRGRRMTKRAQGKPRVTERRKSNDLLVERTRKRKTKAHSSDPQIVTCHNCNESFTSKVRLKFHMQFHDTSLVTADRQYLCAECENKSFATESELFDHVHFQHDKQKRWQCPVAGCGKTFHLRATLTKHGRTHTDTRRYICVTCGKRFLDKQTLDEHGVTHLQTKPFQCHICLKQLTRRSRLRMHVRAHEEALTPKLVLVCAVCSRAFRDHRDSQEHAQKSTDCIEQYANELKEESEEVTTLSPTTGELRYSVRVVDSPRLTQPIKRQVDNSVADPLLSKLADEARTIIRVVEIEKAFRCEYCEDVFYLEEGLNAHRLIHKGVKNPFICHICKVTFTTYSRCTTHKTTHGFYKRPLAEAKKQAEGQEAGPSAIGILGYGGFPVVKHFLCEDCGRSYLHWTYLQVHRRMKHPNENLLFKCNQCELQFPNSWSLAYHKKKMHVKICLEDNGSAEKIAKEDYRIPCRDCEEILPNKTALYRHRKKSHSDISLESLNNETLGVFPSAAAGTQGGNRPPVSLHQPRSSTCSECGARFLQIGDLHAHLKNVHGSSTRLASSAAGRAHACPLCARAFRTASMRNEHLRVHTGERPYPCDVCGVAFRRSTAMRNHRLIHTGVRAWACSRCPKRFRIKSDLRTHLRLKHPAYLAVIEIAGLNPTPDEIMEQLQLNNIQTEKIIEITKMTFLKGTSSIIPSSARALSMITGVPRTKVAYNKPVTQEPSEHAPVRRGRGISKNPRRPKILHRGEDETEPHPAKYPIALDVPGEELTDVDVQLLLREGALANGNDMVQLQLDDSMLIQ